MREIEIVTAASNRTWVGREGTGGGIEVRTAEKYR